MTALKNNYVKLGECSLDLNHPRKLSNWMDKQEQEYLNYGFMWKEEGYAEYIAGGSGINMTDGLQILNGHPNAFYNPLEVEYFKYFLTIKYLIEVKQLTLDQIVQTKMNFDVVLRDAMNNFNENQKT